MQFSSIKGIPSNQYPDAVQALLRRDLEWQSKKPGRSTNRGLACRSGNGDDDDDSRDDVYTLVTAVAQCVGLDCE